MTIRQLLPIPKVAHAHVGETEWLDVDVLSFGVQGHG